MQSGLISLQVPSRASRRPHLSRNFSAKPALSWLARLRESVRDLCQLKDYSHFVGVSKATLHEAVQTVKGMLTQGVAYNKCRAACSGETSGGVLGKQEVRPSSTFHSCDTKLEAASQGRACTSAQLTLTNELSPGSAAAPPGAAASSSPGRRRRSDQPRRRRAGARSRRARSPPQVEKHSQEPHPRVVELVVGGFPNEVEGQHVVHGDTEVGVNQVVRSELQRSDQTQRRRAGAQRRRARGTPQMEKHSKTPHTSV